LPDVAQDGVILISRKRKKEEEERVFKISIGLFEPIGPAVCGFRVMETTD